MRASCKSTCSNPCFRGSCSLASCAEGAQQAPEIADIFALMHLNILKGQLREALNHPAATPASKEAALARYDAARAEWSTQPS